MPCVLVAGGNCFSGGSGIIDCQMECNNAIASCCILVNEYSIGTIGIVGVMPSVMVTGCV